MAHIYRCDGCKTDYSTSKAILRIEFQYVKFNKDHIFSTELCNACRAQLAEMIERKNESK